MVGKNWLLTKSIVCSGREGLFPDVKIISGSDCHNATQTQQRQKILQFY